MWTLRRGDPAPSRLRFRLERYWMTPLYRNLVLMGPPALLLVLGGWHIAHNRVIRHELTSRIEAGRDWVAARPEFLLTRLDITGASPALEAGLREAIAITFPVSSFDVDLAAIRERVIGARAVAEASIQARDGGVLEIRVRERQPVALMREGASLALVDIEGVSLGTVRERSEQARLPVITGEGAEQSIPEALSLVAAMGPVSDRLRGLVRVGDRRWDVVLDRDQRILLPAEEPVEALRRVVGLHAAEEILDRDIRALDMRDSRRFVLRLSPAAIDEYHATRLENISQAKASADGVPR